VRALTGRAHSNQECVRTSTYLIYHCNEFVECMRADRVTLHDASFHRHAGECNGV
jgi:hypothetical protein